MSSIRLLQPLEATAGVSLGTVPNIITVVRTVAAVVIGGAGVAASSLVLLAVAYAVYWVGDIADGWCARRLGQETRIGAVLDIVSDRACTSVLCVGLVAQFPSVEPVAAVFLLTFMFLDPMLSLSFLYWPLLGPNDFHRVDRLVWLLNWSLPGKAANTGGVILAIALGQYGLALAVAVAVLAVKLWTAVRLQGLLRALPATAFA
ncbi:MAG TPA: CDP-alcohol phosphatidyltransferase family protein [Ornithinibacter sp.]|jgi:CDP-diacylglycerol--glycerol-3-phosphate 3-phosphatidyltransferase|nr:CDP-alcohol phosphatidyltransferase family protein [Ornithinibacter sp.]